MDENLTLIKWVTGEKKYFPESIYEVTSDEKALHVIYKKDGSISLECEKDKILYIRYHIPKKEFDSDKN